IVTLVFLIGLPVACIAADAIPAKAPGEDALQKILDERYQTALEMQDIAKSQFEKGVAGVSLADYFKAARRTLKADLARKHTAKEKIAVYEKMIDLAKQNEDRLKQSLKVGSAGTSAPDVLKARYQRLTAESKLQKLKNE